MEVIEFICRFATDRQPRQHSATRFLQAGCPSCRRTNSVKALKDNASNVLGAYGHKLFWSFSKLKLIKNRLRTTMTNERLSHLILINIEYDILRQIDFTILIKDFAKAKSRKVPGL